MALAVISHITLGTNDVDRFARFYDEEAVQISSDEQFGFPMAVHGHWKIALAILGFARLAKPFAKPLAYEKGSMPTLYLYPPEDGRPATWGNGTHIAFVADTREDVRAFHAAALRLGGRSEGDLGPRPHYGDGYYAAYVRDLDGNKLQAVHCS